MAIAPDHPLATAAAATNRKLAEFIAQCKNRGTAQAEIDTAEKLGFDTGIRAVHPFDASWELPVYVANFILMDYGTGAIFGCPAHDQRDLDFALKYGLPVLEVLRPAGALDPTSQQEKDYEAGFRAGPNLILEIFETENQPHVELEFFKITNKAFDVGAEEKYVSQSRLQLKVEEMATSSINLIHLQETIKEQRQQGDFSYKRPLPGAPSFVGSIKEAIDAAIKKAEEKGVGQRQVNFRLRDWGISRQRYWGCPIPVIHCEKCDVVPVPEKEFPVDASAKS